MAQDDAYKNIMAKVEEINERSIRIEQHVYGHDDRIEILEKNQNWVMKKLNQVIGRNRVKDASTNDKLVRYLVYIIAGSVVGTVILSIVLAGGDIGDVKEVLPW